MTPRERALELLADRTTGDLASADRLELDRLLLEEPSLAADESIDRAAASLAAGFASRHAEAMPDEVRDRVLFRLRSMAALTPPQERATPRESRPGRTPPRWMPFAGWLAAAAAVTIAVIAWWPAPKPAPIDPRAEFLRLASDIRRADWSPWDNPEIPGVAGRVEWSESLQRGYMVFSGLRANNPAVEQYQLWIIDERGMEQRISGAIFDSSGTGEIMVPITPGIPVRSAAAFAITIERPGGVWVSDMKRRVVIAPLAG